MIAPVNIVILGPDKSRKGYLISLIAKTLTEHGVNVIVQGAETHNKEKLEKTVDEIDLKIEGLSVLITEQQT
jgi:hypothetical protein